MKTTTLFLSVLLTLMSCQQQAPPPPSNPAPQSTCNPEETALLGKWFMRETSMYSANQLVTSSVAPYNNPQQYIQFNSDLDNSTGIQTTWPGAKTSIWSPMATSMNVNWRCTSDDIYVPAGSPTHRVTFINTDSLVIDYGFSADSSQYNRYTLHR